MAEDRMTKTQFVIRASVVVNAAGPWAAALLKGLPEAAQGAPPPETVSGHERRYQ